MTSSSERSSLAPSPRMGGEGGARAGRSAGITWAAVSAIARHDPGCRLRLQAVLRALARTVPPGSRVLELGCGNGLLSAALATAGYEIVAVDRSATALARARADWGAARSISWLLGDVEHPTTWRQLDGPFHAVVCSEVLEHLESPETVLLRARESLQTGGVLVITVPNGWGPWEWQQRLQRWAGRRPRLGRMVQQGKARLGYTGRSLQSDARDLEHRRFFTVPRLRALLDRTGWRSIRLRNVMVLSPVFPFSLLHRAAPGVVETTDGTLCRITPRSCASTWLLTALPTS